MIYLALRDNDYWCTVCGRRWTGGGYYGYQRVINGFSCLGCCSVYAYDGGQTASRLYRLIPSPDGVNWAGPGVRYV